MNNKNYGLAPLGCLLEQDGISNEWLLLDRKSGKASALYNLILIRVLFLA